jgi:hypothetical protein
MILRCNQGCRKSDGTTDGSLDVGLNEVICNSCGDTLADVSDYAKLSMKTSGDIRRNSTRKAFVFPCNSCDGMVEAAVIAGRLVGKSCPDNTSCKINITETMASTIERIQRDSNEVEK